MRLAVACCFVSIVLVLAGCVSTKVAQPLSGDAALPPEVGNGIGSQYGNYEMHAAGETRGPIGQRCVVFNWDRPLSKDFAIRYSSDSCESKEHPEWMTTTTYTRSVVPISETDLNAARQ